MSLPCFGPLQLPKIAEDPKFACQTHDGQKRQQLRVYGTFIRDLLALTNWLQENGVTHVAMEATGVYFALSSALIGRVEVPPALR
jgi:hypothetical protein